MMEPEPVCRDRRESGSGLISEPAITVWRFSRVEGSSGRQGRCGFRVPPPTGSSRDEQRVIAGDPADVRTFSPATADGCSATTAAAGAEVMARARMRRCLDTEQAAVARDARLSRRERMRLTAWSRRGSLEVRRKQDRPGT